ncbi:MAG: glycosyltransferase family 4 protein [Candidatus Altiarchaeota archaeon]
MKVAGKLKVVFIHPEVRDYRVDVLNRLSEEYDFTFMVIYEKTDVESYPDRERWNYQTFGFHVKVPGTNRAFPPAVFTKILFGDYDVIIASDTTTVESMLAFAAAKLSGKKFVLWNELWDYPPLLRFSVIKPLVKFMARKSDALIAAGSKARQLYMSFGASKEKIFVAPNCAVDYGKIKTGNLREKLGLEGKKVVLYLGRIVAYKGLDYLLQAFAKLEGEISDVSLVVGGSGPFEGECKSIAEELGIRNIVWAGYVKNVASYYQLCDVFVLPARFIRDSVPSEAWGLVLNEVMSVGKPVVATSAVAAAYDLIEDGVNGFMVEEKNADALADALRIILSDDGLAESMGRESRRILDAQYTYDKMFEGFRKAVEHAVKPKP